MTAYVEDAETKYAQTASSICAVPPLEEPPKKESRLLMIVALPAVEISENTSARGTNDGVACGRVA